MISVFKALMAGDESIATQFQIAETFWAEFFADKQHFTAAEFADALGDVQIQFEWKVFEGDRALAKEVMALTAISHLYDEQSGFEPNSALALRVAEGFLTSKCSLEVKGYARKAIQLYRLDDDGSLDHLTGGF